MSAWELIFAGFKTLNEYILQHTLFCLIPAFFIAGGISAFLNQESVMRYFGPEAKKPVAYGVASVSGAILAVCSCTVLPIFMGIYKKGAGLGPAIAFLYSSPAINILAMSYSVHLLGYDIGVVRIVAAVMLASFIGLIMATIFRKEETERAAGAFACGTDPPRPTYQTLIYFGVMIAILVYGTARIPAIVKYLGEAGLVAGLVFLVARWFKKEEIREWMSETWRMTR
ncbi:MAG: permease, partial [Actinobacteria bacterium]|nr:permease [Actinomycetota bacterium]